jgi:hypothetical protein
MYGPERSFTKRSQTMSPERCVKGRSERSQVRLDTGAGLESYLLHCANPFHRKIGSECVC